MAKIRIDGEHFEYDRNHKPMAEMLALEKMLRATYGEGDGQQTLGTTYGQWEEGMAQGAAQAYAVLIWLVWKRDGREKPLAEILASDVNLGDMAIEDDAAPGPTVSRGRAASTSTGANTSARSPKS